MYSHAYRSPSSAFAAWYLVVIGTCMDCTGRTWSGIGQESKVGSRLGGMLVDIVAGGPGHLVYELSRWKPGDRATLTDSIRRPLVFRRSFVDCPIFDGGRCLTVSLDHRSLLVSERRKLYLLGRRTLPFDCRSSSRRRYPHPMVASWGSIVFWSSVRQASILHCHPGPCSGKHGEAPRQSLLCDSCQENVPSSSSAEEAWTMKGR